VNSFKEPLLHDKIIHIIPDVKQGHYAITLQDNSTGKVISEHFARTKKEAFWKFIEFYEGLNPHYTFNPFGRVDNAKRDRRDKSLLHEEESMKSNIKHLKNISKQFLRRPEQSYPVMDVSSALIHEITFRNARLNVFCCSICRKNDVPLADASFSFYFPLPQLFL
jgi:hypothetical protein